MDDYIVDGFILLGQKSLRKREKITSVYIQMGGLQNYTQFIAATSFKCLPLLPILIVRKITFHPNSDHWGPAPKRTQL